MMKVVAALIAAWLLKVKASTIDPDASRITADSILTNLEAPTDQHRRLAIEDFQPLSCNAQVSSAFCRSWTSVFGSSTSFSGRKVVPCGSCVRMNAPGPDLFLHGGLDIQGKLVFPDGYSINVHTPMIVVQGELEMTSSKPVDGVPTIQITMTGRNVEQTFEPIDTNANACGDGLLCEAGENSITVAGGKVTINGMPDDVPAWVRLYDVMGSPEWNMDVPPESYETYPLPPVGCPADGILVDTSGGFPTNRIERMPTFTDEIQRMLEPLPFRTGIPMDQVNPSCLVTGRQYLVTARVRRWKNDVEAGTLTECALTGNNCFLVRYSYEETDGSSTRSLKWREWDNHQSRYGETQTIAFAFEFEAAEVGGRSPIEMQFSLGSDEGVEIEDFILRQAPAAGYPTQESICQELVLGNGDAEQAGRSPFPFYFSHRYGLLDVQKEEDGNHYFSVRGRTGLATNDGLAWDLTLACFREEVLGAIYSFEADIRMHPNAAHPGPANTTVWIEIDSDGPNAFKQIASCPPSDGSTWVHCTSEFELSSDLFSNQVNRLQVIVDSGSPDIDYDMDNISIQFKRSPADNIAVERKVFGGWTAGAEIVLTSYTSEWDKHQERTIVSVHDDYADSGYVRLKLNEAIMRPTTLKESEDFAVEVALLSRNIVFDAGADVDPTEGGHFWVMHTPTVQQNIEGIELRHFGQVGNLGRYPIHFHFCRDVTGSRIARNSIRRSNQRCVVIHGTDNAVIEDNVAYDTRGHCYIVEDGIETGNVFQRNLGAKTGLPEIVISGETDDMPTTFWVTNPTNSWINNIAAGSLDSGFWFETKIRGQRAGLYGHLNPVDDDNIAFDGNVIHSSHEIGIRMYPRTGYTPTNSAHFRNLKVYRNRDSGIFIHTSRNIFVEDSLFADNGLNIDMDRADNTTIRNNVIIGVSEIYREQQLSQNIIEVCHNRRVIGVELHTWADDWRRPHNMIEDNLFYGFSGTGCMEESTFRVDNTVGNGRFESPAFIQRLELVDGLVGHIDFCPAQGEGADFFFTDLDGTLSPAASPTTQPSTLLGNTPNMMHYIRGSPDCINEDSGCYTYCKGTCFRNVRFEVAPNVDPNDTWRIKVCPTDAPSDCIFFHNIRKTGMGGETSESRLSTFTALMPEGHQYTIAFVDEQGTEQWPMFARTTAQKYGVCPTAWQEEDISLVVPPVTEAYCDNLILNGDAENGIQYWNDLKHGLQSVAFLGIDNSRAFASEFMHFQAGFAQHLDTRCFALMEGATYRVQVYTKLRKSVGVLGDVYDCGLNDWKCPEIGLTWNDDVGEISFGEVSPGFAPGKNNFQYFEADFTISSELANANDVKFWVKSNRMDYILIVDDVSIRKV